MGYFHLFFQIRIQLNPFNSLYGIQATLKAALGGLVLSIPFMGYMRNLQYGLPSRASHFQFPLWDTSSVCATKRTIYI